MVENLQQKVAQAIYERRTEKNNWLSMTDGEKLPYMNDAAVAIETCGCIAADIANLDIKVTGKNPDIIKRMLSAQ